MIPVFETLFPVWTLAFLLILCRVTAALFTFPALGVQGIPRHVKIGLSVALAGTWFFQFGAVPPAHVRQLAADPDLLAFLLSVAGEILFGSFLGYAFGLVLLPFRIAGSYVGQELGLTIGNVTDPNTFSSTNVVGQLFEVLALILFFTLDAHHMLFQLMHSSFAKTPLGQGVLILPVNVLSQSISEAHKWGLLLVAPMGIVMFGTVIMLTMLAKSSPQLNLFSVGINVRLLVGLLVMLLFLPELMTFGERLIEQGGLKLRHALHI